VVNLAENVWGVHKVMKKAVPVALFLLAVAVVGAVSLMHAVAMSNGAPQLNCLQCHQDAKNNPAEFVVEGLPEKVEPGKEYTITVKITKGPESKGAAYGGFAVGVSAGQLIVTDKDNTFIATTPTGEKLLTHTKAGSMKREWTFAWKAPETCNGPIVFKIAVIAANGDGSPFGDGYAFKEAKVECGGAAKPTTTTATVVETVTKTTVTETTTYTTTQKSNPGLALGVAVLIFLVVVGGYLLLARK